LPVDVIEADAPEAEVHSTDSSSRRSLLSNSRRFC